MEYSILSCLYANGVLVLSLYGETMSSPCKTFTKPDESQHISVLKLEPKFLVQLIKLDRAFPRLSIKSERTYYDSGDSCTARQCDLAAVSSTKARHLWTIDDWCGVGLKFCKSVATSTMDRVALGRAVAQGSGNLSIEAIGHHILYHSRQDQAVLW